MGAGLGGSGKTPHGGEPQHVVYEHLWIYTQTHYGFTQKRMEWLAQEHTNCQSAVRGFSICLLIIFLGHINLWLLWHFGLNMHICKEVEDFMQHFA